MAEALGMVLPGVAGTPATDSRLLQAAHESGRRIIDMVKEDLKPSDILTKGAFINAIATLAGIGGSTNAVVHLLAIAGRVGVDLTLKDFDQYGSNVPLLLNLQPAGSYLMEDMHRAGGLLAVMRELIPHFDSSAITVTGRPFVETLAEAEIYDRDVIRELANPLQEKAGIVVLYGNLAPLGAVIKPSAATPELLHHRGPALVFDGVEDFHARIDDPSLVVDKNTVLILRGCGPKGYPGMPEVANLILPQKLLEKGVTDMVRICDGRMSGTAYGTVILHVAPEAAAGGPLGLVKDGDIIELDVTKRSLNIDISAEELALRKPSEAMIKTFAKPVRGWERLYIDHVMQADRGADFDFLYGASGSAVPRESH
jgi:dihydroxy-acid dehydratase